jgi:hypothetical protein
MSRTSFVGRADEQAELRRQLDIARTDIGGFVWMRGRRRVGKSRLVQEFCDASGVPYCFYQAPRRGQEEALREFCAAVAESDLPAASTFADASFASWPAALRAATAGATAERPVIIVIDELPYLTEYDPGFAADLQKSWDRDLERLPVLLIGVGSDVRMMRELVTERSTLHGRPTRELRVAPLDPLAVADITGAEGAADAIDRYMIVGGFPLLAAGWPRGAGIGEFLRSALADDETPFVTTAERIMAAELDGELQARRVLEAIGSRRERARSHRDPQRCQERHVEHGSRDPHPGEGLRHQAPALCHPPGQEATEVPHHGPVPAVLAAIRRTPPRGALTRTCGPDHRTRDP